jgi:hypothetical protein
MKADKLIKMLSKIDPKTEVFVYACAEGSDDIMVTRKVVLKDIVYYRGSKGRWPFCHLFKKYHSPGKIKSKKQCLITPYDSDEED